MANEAKTKPMGILPIIQEIVAGVRASDPEELEQLGATFPRARRGVQHIIGIADPLFRELRLAVSDLTDEATRKGEAHKKLHKDGTHKMEECERFHRELEALGADEEVLVDLSWALLKARIIGYEHVEAVHLNQGWQIGVTLKDGASPESVRLNDSCELEGMLKTALMATEASVSPKLGPCDEGKGEKVIGTVTDPVIQALWCIRDRIFEDIRAQVPDENRLEAFIDDKTMGEVRSLVEEIGRRKRMSAPIENLTWRAVRNHLSAEDDVIGLRDGWQVVSVPREPDSGLLAALLGLGRPGMKVIGPFPI